MSQLNPLNDLSRVYLDHIANTNQENDAKDIKRWEEGNAALDKQMVTSSQQLATLGAPTMEEEKKAAKDYDGDGKVESGKDEYFGSKDKAIKKAMKEAIGEGDPQDDAVKQYVKYSSKTKKKKSVKEDAEPVDEAMSSYDRARKAAARRAADRNAARRRGEMGGRMERETYTDERGVDMHHKGYRATPVKEAIGEGDPQDDAVKQYVKFSSKKRPKAVKKVKESFSNWRQDLIEIADDVPMTDTEAQKIVKEKKVNNKVVINPKMTEAVAQIGGEVISETQVELDEKQKDTPDQVKAVIAFDKARKGTDDATYDSEHGKKKQAKKERDYAKWQRDKGAEDAQKSGHRWKHAKGSTREKEGKKSETHAYIKDSAEYIVANLHHLNETDIADILGRLEKKRIRQGGNPDESPLGKKTGRAMKDQQDKARKKAGMSEGVLGKKTKSIVSKEVKELEKSLYTMKDKNVVKADKTDTPNYKGYKFGVKEAKDWIQGAVKRPGAFTRKAKAAGQSVQQFAKTVDDNPSKYSTRTKRQANLAQTFASMKKEDVEEMIFNYIAESNENT